MEIKRGGDKEWEIAAQFEGWHIGFIAYGEKFSRFSMLERHNKTDAVFVLVKGEATLYVADKDIKVGEYNMEQGAVYSVAKGEWHSIAVSKDALVMVVENSDTSSENSDYLTLA